MRRALTVLIVPLLLATGLASPQAEAQLPPATHLVTGRLYNPWGDKPVPAGMTVKLRKVVGNTVGAVVATDRTNRKGRFVLHAGASGQYVVQVKGGQGFLGGYLGDSPLMAASTKSTATRFGSTAALGKIWTDPSYIQGKAVDAGTLAPLNKVEVTVYANDLTTVLGTDVTGADGLFKVSGLSCRMLCGLYVSGDATTHETGWVACDHSVVATWGAACSSELGRIGRVYLDPV